MTRLNVNPTRMELKKLKARLKTAVRGHKLLKDKSDEMIRRFSILIRENKKLRDEVESDVSALLKQFAFARGLTRLSDAEQAFSMPTLKINAEYKIGNVMGVDVPEVVYTENQSSEKLPYAYTSITSEADYSVELLLKVMPRLIKLAEVEKTVKRLADEIEKNKRRVNALEHVMIPQLEETIKYIKNKLDENERAALIRLMKVKQMIEKAE